MKGRSLWFTISILLAAILLLVSCGKTTTVTTTPSTTTQPAIIQTTTTKPATTTAQPTTTKPATTTTPTASADTPKYGGLLNVILSGDIPYFDLGNSTNASPTAPMYLVSDRLANVDWARGPAGTGELELVTVVTPYPEKYYTGGLAESWEKPDAVTTIYRLRKDVHYATNLNSEAAKLVAGREFTADDVVYNITRDITDIRAVPRWSNPALSAGTTVKKIDKYTVELKSPVEPWTSWLWWFAGSNAQMVPQEVVQKYGDMNDWRNVVGTGPFIIADYVQGSSMLMKRNSNYWMKDPVGPGKGNQLPYMDGLYFLIMPDVSTQLAALRTGKADQMSNVSYEDAQGLIKTTPLLKTKEFLSARGFIIGMRQDKKELPVSNLKVRQALMMGTDFKAIRDGLYTGKADILVWPIINAKGFEDAYYPLDKLPAEVQALYTYNPDQAKKLLAEAGYQSGFNTTITYQNVTWQADYLSAIKGMWAKIGVTVTLDPKETAAFNTLGGGRSYNEMIFRNNLGFSSIGNFAEFNGTSSFNISRVDDDRIKQVYQEVLKYVAIDQPRVLKLYHDLLPYVLGQAYNIPRPTPFTYNVWQPWLKNYHGEDSVYYSTPYTFLPYVWLDTSLKKSMGY